jgi:hypothetical protein
VAGVVEFVGGPIDGHLRMLEELLPVWRVPVMVPVVYTAENPGLMSSLPIGRVLDYYRDAPLMEGHGPRRVPTWRYRLRDAS